MLERVAASKSSSQSKTAETVLGTARGRKSAYSPQQESAQARVFNPLRSHWNIGNIALQAPAERGLPPWPIQAKLEVGAVDDPLEREADRVADRVMRMASPGVTAWSPATGTPGKVQRDFAVQQVSGLGSSSTRPGMTVPPVVHEVLNSPGQPLDTETRSFFEPRFGYNFTNVRVHTGSRAAESADSVRALAYTVNHSMAFGAGRYAPHSAEGRRLLAHELAHVVQQSSSTFGLHGNLAGPSPTPMLQRQPHDDQSASDSDVSGSTYPEEEEVIRYAIGAHDLRKLADGTVLYEGKGWNATGISDHGFVVGPFTSDMGNILYVYGIEGADEKAGTHAVSRSVHLIGWRGAITPDVRRQLSKASGGKPLVVKSSPLIPPPGGAKTLTQSKDRTQGSGTPAPTDGKAKSPEQDPAQELTPFRKTWLTAGRENVKAQIRSSFNSIQKIKQKRIDAWGKNTAIKDPKPIKAALEFAVEVTGYGMGAVVGGLLIHEAEGLLEEFIKEAALKSTANVAELIFAKAAEPAEELESEATKEALKNFKDEKKAETALASKGGLVDCYTEAMSLQSIDQEDAENAEFNSTVDSKFSDLDLVDELALYKALYEKLNTNPQTYLRELTVGLLQLKDKMYLLEKAKDYGGSEERALKEDPHIHETSERSGNVLLIPSAIQWDLGKYFEQPDVRFDSFHGLATEVNTATLMELSGAKVKDLPITLTFRFWADSPFRNLPERILGLPGELCKVWFERRGDGTVWVDFDEPTEGDSVSEGIEWLASYYMRSIGLNAGHELSGEERRKYAPPGAKKIYDLIKDKPVVGFSNSDIF